MVHSLTLQPSLSRSRGFSSVLILMESQIAAAERRSNLWLELATNIRENFAILYIAPTSN